MSGSEPNDPSGQDVRFSFDPSSRSVICRSNQSYDDFRDARRQPPWNQPDVSYFMRVRGRPGFVLSVRLFEWACDSTRTCAMLLNAKHELAEPWLRTTLMSFASLKEHTSRLVQGPNEWCEPNPTVENCHATGSHLKSREHVFCTQQRFVLHNVRGRGTFSHASTCCTVDSAWCKNV